MDTFGTFLDVMNAYRRKDDIKKINAEIQELISNGHFNGSSTLLKKLSDLDWAIRKD